ncbi:MAG: hypothetical protein J5895_00955 [Alphaproteobacteria bacterium]|nr:hypothetical protein [Alphaproteobacteria bacterium]
MEQALDYKVIITNEGILVFLIASRNTEPEKPFLLYDGGKHATLYRTENETVALDYIAPEVVPILSGAEKVLIFEMDDEIEDVLRSYEAPVKHIKRNVFVESL